MANITDNKNRNYIILSGILSVILWKVPYAQIILFPLNMFSTYLHEASHGLTAILTGGSLLSFTMQLDTSGLAYTSGGFRPLVISAGYIGNAIWGSLLLLASAKRGYEKRILTILSIFFFLFTFLFARNFVAFFSGIFFGLSIILLTRIKLNTFISSFLAFLAVQTCFNSFHNIVELFYFPKGTVTDAQLLSNLTLGVVPPFIFALSWCVISLVIFFYTLKKILKSDKDINSI